MITVVSKITYKKDYISSMRIWSKEIYLPMNEFPSIKILKHENVFIPVANTIYSTSSEKFTIPDTKLTNCLFSHNIRGNVRRNLDIETMINMIESRGWVEEDRSL